MREPFQMPFHNFKIEGSQPRDIAKSEPFEYHELGMDWYHFALIAQVVLPEEAAVRLMKQALERLFCPESRHLSETRASQH